MKYALIKEIIGPEYHTIHVLALKDERGINKLKNCFTLEVGKEMNRLRKNRRIGTIHIEVPVIDLVNEYGKCIFEYSIDGLPSGKTIIRIDRPVFVDYIG